MSIYQRIAAVTVLMLSVILLPWWVSFAVSIVLSTRYVAYEVLIAGFILDRMYGVAQPSLIGFELPFEIGSYVFTVLFGLIFFVSVFAKRYIIFYRGYA